ncbi:MAG: sensor domain-containing diguanylate cyclase [Alphaproteobacteria bacterium]|nr:sensor domain-containing diguanylate cyclase [Alphaproteobacteria bacterium]
MTKAAPPYSLAERRRNLRRRDDTLLPNFQDMTDGAVQGVLVHSNFKPLYANRAFAHLFGYDKAEEITAMPLIRPLYPHDIWPEVEQEYNDLVRGDKIAPISRIKGLRRDGQEIWLACTKRVIDWHGSKALQICAFDVTNQVAMEQLMLGNEQQLRSILEILPVPIFISRRRDGHILFVNRKTCLLLQQSAGPLLRACSPEFFVEEEDRKKIHMMVDAVNDVREVEVRMKTAQGREFIAELAAINVDYSGEPAMLVSVNDISERKKLEAELFHQANTDSLTGLSNRRFFMIQAEQEIRRARRFNRALSIIMMDLDHFKLVNDTHGHAAGDAVLETIVRASLESLRESDVMGRLGGEEFAVILPETTIEAAAEVAGRLLAHIAETAIPTTKGIVHCTTSLGVAQLIPQDNTIDELLCRADEALFLAKERGRNRVEISEK